MTTPTTSISSDTFLRSEVQDILDAAQLAVNHLYADTPTLREALEEDIQDAIEECNSRELDPMQILHQQMRTERLILDAYNKHRLGNALTSFNNRVLNPENEIEYLEEENIPEELEFFPVRSEVSKRGIEIIGAAPIYQLPGTVEHNQKFTARPTTKTATAMNAAGKRPTSETKHQTEKKKIGFGSPNYNKLRDAPSPWLEFPRGNMTMAELAAFIPQSFKSVDVIDRVVRNGAFSATLAGMMNHFREMGNGPITNNSIYRMMKGPMDKENPEWTVAKHGSLEMPANFDPTSVSMTSFRTPENPNTRDADDADQVPAPTILFRDLAKGVKLMPSGYDALDLTRCVEYCVNNKDEDWYYPQDFEELVEHLGGPDQVHREHQDDAAVRRHTSERKLKGARRAGKRKRDDHGRLLKQKKGESFIDSDEEEAIYEDSEEEMYDVDFDALDSDDEEQSTQNSKRRDALGSSYSPRRKLSDRTVKTPSRLRETFSFDVNSESDSDNYVGPKNRKKSRTVTRSSKRTKRFAGSYDIDRSLEPDDDEEHAPPPYEGPRSLADIRDAFRQRNAEKAAQSAAARATAAVKDQDEEMDDEEDLSEKDYGEEE